MILGNILAHSRSLRQASCGPYYSTTQTGSLEVLRALLSGGLGRVQEGDGLQLGLEGWGATLGEDTVCAGVRQGRSLCVRGTGHTGLTGESGSHGGSWLEQHLGLVTAG